MPLIKEKNNLGEVIKIRPIGISSILTRLSTKLVKNMYQKKIHKLLNQRHWGNGISDATNIIYQLIKITINQIEKK